MESLISNLFLMVSSDGLAEIERIGWSEGFLVVEW